MRARTAVVIAAALTLTGCERNLSPATRAVVTDGVRQFARDVAHDVTREGPAAWHRHFASTPAFFMAANGRLVFSNATAATHGVEDLRHSIRSIELRWGDDLRVDPLTPDLAVMASSWSELRVAADGARMTDHGYFTGVAERRDGRWKFRDAHWSVGVPEQKPP
jgi:hypothetical protein